MAWLFTVHGFFSVVCGRHQRGPKKGQLDEDTTMVRSRSKVHLVALQQAHPDLIGKLTVKSTKGTDYPHRLVMAKEVWVQIATRIATGVCYGNVKSAVASEIGAQDPGYLELMHRVWHEGVAYQDRLG